MKASPILPLAFLLLLSAVPVLADIGASRPPPRLPGAPQLRPDASPVAQVHVDTAQTAVKSALTALARATTTSHGGYIEKAMVEANKAADDLTQATAYLKAHPDANTLANGPAPAETSPPKFTVAPQSAEAVRPGNGVTAQTNMVTALDALNAALNEFINPAASTYKGPVMGDLGGLRPKIMGDLVQANTDVLAGINYANGTGPAATPAPATPPPAKATADNSDNSQRLPSAIAGLALSAALSLGGLHAFSRKKSAKK